jgi:hypothetical protein
VSEKFFFWLMLTMAGLDALASLALRYLGLHDVAAAAAGVAMVHVVVAALMIPIPDEP